MSLLTLEGMKMGSAAGKNGDGEGEVEQGLPTKLESSTQGKAL